MTRKPDVRNAAVKDYLRGTATRKEVAKRHGVPLSTLALWVKQERGNAPIAKKTLAEDDEPRGNGAAIAEETLAEVRAARAASRPEQFELVQRLLGENERLRRLVQTLLELQIQGHE